jgi:hypothetical protein
LHAHLQVEAVPSQPTRPAEKIQGRTKTSIDATAFTVVSLAAAVTSFTAAVGLRRDASQQTSLTG